MKPSLNAMQSATNNYGWSDIAAAIWVSELRFLVALALAVIVLGPTGAISAMCQDTTPGASVRPFPQGVGGPPKVWVLLSRVGDKYSRLRSYDFKVTQQMTIEAHGSEYRHTDPAEEASAGTPETIGFLFTRGQMAKIAGNGPPWPSLRFGMSALYFYRFDKLPGDVTSARPLGEGAVFANGKNKRCDIIQIHWRPQQGGEPDICVGNLETLWVDKANYLVLRTSFSKFNTANSHLTKREVATFNSYELNSPLPEWLQNVKRQSEEQERALSARMTTEAAPGFTLKDLGASRFPWKA